MHSQNGKHMTKRSGKTKHQRIEPLNRERVLQTALRLLDREGLAALSMRRLGNELGVEAMSLYNHIGSKEDVCDGIVELLMQEIQRPEMTAASWRDGLQAAFRAYRQVLRAHPAALPIVATRPLNTIAAFHVVEDALTVLRQAGFTPIQAIYALNCLAGYVIGHALLDVGTTPFSEGSPDPAHRTLDLGHLSADQFPTIRELLPAFAERSPDEEFEFGLTTMLCGLQPAGTT
jgi:AcrR family transcriptional regulator